MTPEQKERIKAAVRELEAALTAAGHYFRVEANAYDVTTMESKESMYAYDVSVRAIREEIIR